jgi:hypothetical protein
VFFPVDAWVHEKLDLNWYRTEYGSCDGVGWSDSRAFVWGRKIPYCAASVWVRDGKYLVRTAGLHGLTAKEEKSLEAYLESQNLTKMPS